MSTLPAGYRFEKIAGSRWEIRGPGNITIINQITPSDPDAGLIAEMHWQGYRAGVLATIAETKRAAILGGGIAAYDELTFHTIAHDLLYQIHIV